MYGFLFFTLVDHVACRITLTTRFFLPTRGFDPRIRSAGQPFPEKYFVVMGVPDSGVWSGIIGYGPMWTWT